MTKEELLSQLKGIHLPSNHLAWWDMAPGWYGLIAITLILMVCLLVFYFYQRNKKLKQTKLLQRVDNIYQAYRNDCHQYASQISILLKQAVLKSTSDKSLMIMHGKQWEEYLTGYSQDKEIIKILIQSSYDPKVKFDAQKVNQEVRFIYTKLLK